MLTIVETNCSLLIYIYLCKVCTLCIKYFLFCFVGLFVSKTYLPDFQENLRKGVAWTKEEPVTFWNGWNYTNLVSFSLTLRDMGRLGEFSFAFINVVIDGICPWQTNTLHCVPLQLCNEIKNMAMRQLDMKEVEILSP